MRHDRRLRRRHGPESEEGARRAVAAGEVAARAAAGEEVRAAIVVRRPRERERAERAAAEERVQPESGVGARVERTTTSSSQSATAESDRAAGVQRERCAEAAAAAAAASDQVVHRVAEREVRGRRRPLGAARSAGRRPGRSAAALPLRLRVRTAGRLRAPPAGLEVVEVDGGAREELRGGRRLCWWRRLGERSRGGGDGHVGVGGRERVLLLFAIAQALLARAALRDEDALGAVARPTRHSSRAVLPLAHELPSSFTRSNLHTHMNE